MQIWRKKMGDSKEKTLRTKNKVWMVVFFVCGEKEQQEQKIFEEKKSKNETQEKSKNAKKEEISKDPIDL